MTITGGCLCGAVRFEAAAAPLMVAFCHCGSCRKQTGAPVAAYVDFRRADVRFVAGAPTRFGSSPGAWRGFCGACGSTLTFEGDNLPGEIHIHLGALDEPENFAPEKADFPELELPWLCLGAQGADA
ncbi:MAG: GFA family protein [Hyphomonadaceae bacterium]|nr:GFA family protein [Hyphomonadaceae bacterium]